ncbi:hypothetical protein KTAU_17000 [Thermogemmatispora aurantia]|uniref:Uncharacterized protein n=1 Tax=Thermogemmatispora aurantia TaxID=2045279 RepID=A0A5J4K6C3_9CHLR|nr:hypothetical protein KTAU_17000 [Thermogemmatispora aurantia]
MDQQRQFIQSHPQKKASAAQGYIVGKSRTQLRRSPEKPEASQSVAAAGQRQLSQNQASAVNGDLQRQKAPQRWQLAVCIRVRSRC